MSNKVKFISRARKAKLLKQLSEVQEGTPEAKAIRKADEAKKKKAEAAKKKVPAEKKKKASKSKSSFNKASK